MHDARSFRRTPDAIRFRIAIVVAAKEPIEASDVIHVEVREAQVIDPHDLRDRKLRETALATVEQQAFDSLPAVDAHQKSVVSTGWAEDLKCDAHSFSLLPRLSD